MDVEATPAHRTAEVKSTKTIIDRVETRFGIKLKRLVGDTAYGVASLLNWMVQEKEIAPHAPVWDKTKRKDDRDYKDGAGRSLKARWRVAPARPRSTNTDR